MNYYAFHLGDYTSATQHLSWDEDMAYRRLIDAYYTREKPLPTEPRAIYRLARAATNEQREAVDTVLAEFFILTEEGWRHSRCDAEIEAIHDKRAKASQSAKARWGNAARQGDAMPSQCERNANAMRPDSERIDDECERTEKACEGNAPNPNPNPISYKEPSGSLLGADKPPKRNQKRATELPEDFEPDETGKALARELGVMQSELQLFRDHHRAVGSTMKDWQAAWRTWVRKAARFARPARGAQPSQMNRQQALEERNRQVADAWVRKMQAGMSPDCQEGEAE